MPENKQTCPADEVCLCDIADLDGDNKCGFTAEIINTVWGPVLSPDWVMGYQTHAAD